MKHSTPLHFKTKITTAILFAILFFTNKNANAQTPELRVPKTMEEYRKMLWEDRVKKQQQQQRIAQIKSTKMMFTTHPESHINLTNIKSTKNNLRMMNFNHL